jgi:hypothetical protein
MSKREKRALLDELQGPNVAEEQRPLSREEKLQKKVVTTQLEKATLLEEVL